LHALPEEEAPRSFVLPENLSFVPEQTIQQIPVPQKQRVRFNTLRRSIRVVSTLAAVLALFFIISGILPFMNFGGSGSTSTATSSSTSGEASTVHSAANTPGIHETTNVRPQESAATTTPTPIPTQTLSPTRATPSKTNSGIQPTNQGPSIPSVLDPGQSAGRISLGVLLLVLGIIGLIITRRRRVTLND
jgi:hypothetical protein